MKMIIKIFKAINYKYLLFLGFHILVGVILILPSINIKFLMLVPFLILAIYPIFFKLDYQLEFIKKLGTSSSLEFNLSMFFEFFLPPMLIPISMYITMQLL